MQYKYYSHTCFHNYFSSTRSLDIEIISKDTQNYRVPLPIVLCKFDRSKKKTIVTTRKIYQKWWRRRDEKVRSESSRERVTRHGTKVNQFLIDRTFRRARSRSWNASRITVHGFRGGRRKEERGGRRKWPAQWVYSS